MGQGRGLRTGRNHRRGSATVATGLPCPRSWNHAPLCECHVTANPGDRSRPGSGLV